MKGDMGLSHGHGLHQGADAEFAMFQKFQELEPINIRKCLEYIRYVLSLFHYQHIKQQKLICQVEILATGR